MHCKKVIEFPVPSRDVINQTLPGREYCNKMLFFTVWHMLTMGLGPWRSSFVYLLNLLSSLISLFLPSKSKLIGDVLMGRQITHIAY